MTKEEIPQGIILLVSDRLEPLFASRRGSYLEWSLITCRIFLLGADVFITRGKVSSALPGFGFRSLDLADPRHKIRLATNKVIVVVGCIISKGESEKGKIG